jgi:ornithine carbamoyltransferase
MCARPHVRRHRISRLHPDRGGGTGAPRGCAGVERPDERGHPTQLLADLLTMQEYAHKPLEQVTFCFLGDAGYNMADLLMIGAAKMGMDLRLPGPRQSWSHQGRLDQVRASAKETDATVTVTEDAAAAVKGCDFLYTDVDATYQDRGTPRGKAMRNILRRLNVPAPLTHKGRE